MGLGTGADTRPASWLITIKRFGDERTIEDSHFVVIRAN